MDASQVQLSFERGAAAGSPVLLIHGLASNAHACWADTGMCRALDAAGLGWIAPDLPGHGKSPKPYEPAAYRLPILAESVVAVLDEADVATADVVGYSLGAHIALTLAALHPERVRRLVLGGIGSAATPPAHTVAQFLTRLPPSVDREAINACVLGVSQSATPDPAAVRARTLLIAGTDDALAMTGIDSLAAALADACVVRIPGRNHFNVLTAPAFKRGIVDFLQAP